MKQHITVEMLNELTPKGKEKLREWWKPKAGDLVIDLSWSEMIDFTTEDREGMWPELSLVEEDKETHLILLSIGQMIEFLEENMDEKYLLSIEPDETLWIVCFCETESKKARVVWPDFELVDALWKAVKEVLERE